MFSSFFFSGYNDGYFCPDLTYLSWHCASTPLNENRYFRFKWISLFLYFFLSDVLLG